MKSVFALFLLFFANAVASAGTPIQPLIDAAQPLATITLTDGEYDDPTPVYIRKDVTLQGSRNAIVHSEFQIVSGANVHFQGFTLDMNKTGAPARNGVNSVYPQNGMVVVLGAVLWADDLEVHLEPGLTGYALQKNAFHVTSGGSLELRAVTKFSRVDWRNSPYQVIELLYGSYANIFDITPNQLAMNIVSGTSSTGGPLGSGAAAIQLAGSKMTMSGSNVFNFGTATMGVYAMRDSYVQIGAGIYTTVQNFGANSVFLDPTSRKWIAPGSLVN